MDVAPVPAHAHAVDAPGAQAPPASRQPQVCYRKLRDVYALGQHMRDVRSACVGRHPPPYDVLIALIGHLKACADVAQQRTYNCQRFCFKNEFVLRFLVEAVCLLGDDFN